MITAAEMTPGHTYIGTRNGPCELIGVRFTYLSAEVFYPEPDEPWIDLLDAVVVVDGAERHVNFAPGDGVVPEAEAEDEDPEAMQPWPERAPEVIRYGVTIDTQVDSPEEVADLLREVARLVESGNTSGHSPHWSLTTRKV